MLATPSYRVLSEHVADSIRQVILSGRFKPGDRLVEHELATELDVSRAPVRDALRLLAKQGLVTLVPHRGAIVTAISVDMVVDAFSVRAVLEGMAARLALTRLTSKDIDDLDAVVDEMELAGKSGDAVRLVEQDIEFHRLLTASCQRPILLEALGAISNKTYLLITATRYAYPLDRLAELHAWIVQAVRSGNPDRLEAAVRDHIAYGQHVLLTSLAESSAIVAGPVSALPPSVHRGADPSRGVGYKIDRQTDSVRR